MAADYILRLTEQIAAMLASIVAKKGAGQLAEARGELEQTCLLTIGLTLERLKQLSPEAVAHLLKDAGALRTNRAVQLAELLLLDAEWHAAEADAFDPLASHVHAFCLLADAMDALSADAQAIYRAKLNLLADRLGGWRTHPYLKERLRDYGTTNDT